MQKNVLWIHNFNPEIKNSGVFMHQAYLYLRKNYSHEYNIDLLYLGNLRNPFNLLLNIIKIINLSKKYHIVHAQFGSACGLIASFAKTKKILTLRGSDWHTHSTQKTKFAVIHNKLQNYFSKTRLSKFNAILTVSNRMKEEVGNFLKTETPIITLPSPVDINKFFIMEKSICKEKLGLKPDIKYLLYPVMKIGNRIKRPELILSLQKSLPKNIEIITATGIAHDEMPYLYNAVDYVILPSQYEGWPNVVKEGLACDTPFICTDISDLKEISSKNPECKIIEPNVESIINSLSFDYKKNGKLRHYISHMSMEEINMKMIQIYSQMTDIN